MPSGSNFAISFREPAPRIVIIETALQKQAKGPSNDDRRHSPAGRQNRCMPPARIDTTG